MPYHKKVRSKERHEDPCEDYIGFHAPGIIGYPERVVSRDPETVEQRECRDAAEDYEQCAESCCKRHEGRWP